MNVNVDDLLGGERDQVSRLGTQVVYGFHRSRWMGMPYGRRIESILRVWGSSVAKELFFFNAMSPGHRIDFLSPLFKGIFWEDCGASDVSFKNSMWLGRVGL